jgi:hypothetical protein
MSNQQVRIIDPILSNVALGYIHPQAVGRFLFPEVPVDISGGQVIEFGKESFKLYNTVRAPGSNTRRISYGYVGNKFALTNHSLEGQVPFEHLRDAAVMPGIALGSIAVMNVMDTLKLELEVEQANTARDAAQYDANHKVDLAAAKWTNDANDPIKDIDAGREAIRAAVGTYPNILVLSAKAFNAAKNNANVINRFKYTGRDSITAEMLASIWNIPQVVVGEAIYFDDAGTAYDVWGSDAILAYAPSQKAANIQRPSFGYTYTMRGHPLAEQPYMDRNAKSWEYPVAFERAPVLTGITSGYLIQNAA